MRTFELRVYTLRTQEALDFYGAHLSASSQQLSAVRD
jgi:hypothetical protein